MHYFGHFDEAALKRDPLYELHSSGYTRAVLIERATASVHTGLSIEELEAGGAIAPHLHSFEEGFFVLSGGARVTIDTTTCELRPGDYGAVKVGTSHSWHAHTDGPVRWLQMGAPQPKPSGAERDTFFPTLAGAAAGHQPVPWRTHPTRVEEAAEHGALLGHFNIDRIPPPALGVAAAKGLEGVYLKWLLDENVGTVHHRLLFIEYQPGVSIGLHDHAFEEAYFILSGEVQATLDGQVYRAKAGDVLWTGVGCVHSFANLGTEPVRWLETFAPQPPKENVFRFVAEWDARARELEGPQ